MSGTAFHCRKAPSFQWLWKREVHWIQNKSLCPTRYKPPINHKKDSHAKEQVEAAKLQSNFTEITLQHGCSPVNLPHISRTPFSKNTIGWLLLNKEKTKIKSAKLSTKQLLALHKSFEVLPSRDIPMAEILQDDLFPTNTLFDEGYKFKPDKV